MLKYTWICPIKGCNAYGKALIAGHLARKYGKKHLQRVHGITDVEPNLAIVKTIKSHRMG